MMLSLQYINIILYWKIETSTTLMNQRLLSLDVFRGLTVFFMIIVNSSGNWATTFAPLRHAKWHGFTPTDLVFPSFLFAIGASMAIVIPRLKSNATRSSIYLKILKRTAIIFLLGFLMYWFPFFDLNVDGELIARPISKTRILGVLQRLALAYGITAVLLYKFQLSTVIKIGVGILIGYWLLMMGLGDYTLAGNAAQQIDLVILTADHLYMGEGVPFDPEGLLSTLPCIANVIAGYATVYYLLKSKENFELLLKVTLVGTLLIALGCLWHYAFPINKKLWTSSFAIMTSGIDILLLVALHYLLDLKKNGLTFGNIFTPMGKNPLFIYLLSEVGIILLAWLPHGTFDNYYNATYINIFKPVGEYFGAFLFALTWTMICWAVAWWMDKKKIYIRV